MTTTETNQQLGRSKNAMLTFFERRLSVPKIYVNAQWNGKHVDVIAIDRDGIGDVHVALLFARGQGGPDGMASNLVEKFQWDETIEDFKSIPAQFKYACPTDFESPKTIEPSGSILPTDFLKRALASDGLGRIGLAHIAVPVLDDPSVELLIKPERFRAVVGKSADEYVAQHSADWEIRA
jgi:hypothetical protein